jgi:hypothetical protein
MPLSSLLVLALGLGLTALPRALGTVVISDPSLVSGNTYDYIIAGGGLTGLTVRLYACHYSIKLISPGESRSPHGCARIKP